MIKEFRGEHRFLSNFHESPVKYEKKTYPTLEHAFQAAKTLNEDAREGIRKAITPGDAKRLGRGVELRPGWEKCKQAVMSILVSQKFRSGTPLARKLMDTDPHELQEGNTWGDKIWGVDLATGKGENKLGKVLMEVRQDLFDNIDHEDTREIVCPWCGNEYIDSWEAPDEDDSEECGDCGKEFGYRREHEITYSSWKVKPKKVEA